MKKLKLSGLLRSGLLKKLRKHKRSIIAGLAVLLVAGFLLAGGEKVEYVGILRSVGKYRITEGPLSPTTHLLDLPRARAEKEGIKSVNLEPKELFKKEDAGKVIRVRGRERIVKTGGYWPGVFNVVKAKKYKVLSDTKISDYGKWKRNAFVSRYNCTRGFGWNGGGADWSIEDNRIVYHLKMKRTTSDLKKRYEVEFWYDMDTDKELNRSGDLDQLKSCDKQNLDEW